MSFNLFFLDNANYNLLKLNGLTEGKINREQEKNSTQEKKYFKNNYITKKSNCEIW